MAAIQAALLQDDVAILTLTGPGGVGKTRLAQRVMANLADDFNDGVHFVSLAPIRSPERVVPAIAQEFGLRVHGDRTYFDALLAFLRGKALLLVLDNFEQVIPAAPQIGALASTCPALKVLVTSRERLNLHDESVFQVRPLALPDIAIQPSTDELMQSPAARLFGMRAQAVAPDFQITAANAATVDAICRRLDALPLAIELAAAWSATLAPSDLLARLERRLPLLTRGARDHPERLQTMRQTIAWSYDLLSPDEQAGFRRLSVFVSDFTLDEAAAVAGGTGDDGVAYLISSLIAKSIIVRLPDSGNGAPQRFRMLETIREFGIEQLIAAGEEDDTRRLHAHHYFGVITSKSVTYNWMFLAFEPESPYNQIIRASYGNVRSALEFLVFNEERERALEMATRLATHWWLSGQYSECESWLRRTLHPPEACSLMLRADALWAMSMMIHEQGRIEDSTPLAAESIALYRETGDDLALIRALSNYSNIELSSGQFERARETALEALALSRQAEFNDAVAGFLMQLGRISVELGELENAQRYHEEAQLHLRTTEFPFYRSVCTLFYGRTLHARKNLDQALAVLQECLAEFWRWGFPSGVARSVESIAEVAADDGQSAVAVRFFAAVSVLRDQIGHPIDREDRSAYDRAISMACRELGDATFQKHWAEGFVTPINEIVREALALQINQLVQPEPASDDRLTAREFEVLRCLIEGISNREIADALFISERTVDNHVFHILGKFGVSTRTAAAMYAVRNGLV